MNPNTKKEANSDANTLLDIGLPFLAQLQEFNSTEKKYLFSKFLLDTIPDDKIGMYNWLKYSNTSGEMLRYFQLRRGAFPLFVTLDAIKQFEKTMIPDLVGIDEKDALYMEVKQEYEQALTEQRLALREKFHRYSETAKAKEQHEELVDALKGLQDTTEAAAKSASIAAAAATVTAAKSARDWLKNK